ncbi:MAG: hypothetical protein ACYS8W_04075 [Planctomycetota bacterium]|jgi:hypothetical protein
MDKPAKKGTGRIVWALFIGVAVFFGILVAVLFSYKPIKFNYHFGRLTHSDDKIRTLTVKAFREMGTKYRERLIEKVTSLSAERKNEILAAFMKNDALDIFPERLCIDYLKDLILHSDEKTGKNALHALKNAGKRSAEVISDVMTVKRDYLEVRIEKPFIYELGAGNHELVITVRNASRRNIWYFKDYLLVNLNDYSMSFTEEIKLLAGERKAAPPATNSYNRYMRRQRLDQMKMAIMEVSRKGFTNLNCLPPGAEETIRHMPNPSRSSSWPYYIADPVGKHKTVWICGSEDIPDSFDEYDPTIPVKMAITASKDLNKRDDKKKKEIERFSFDYYYLPTDNAAYTDNVLLLDFVKPGDNAVVSTTDRLEVAVSLKNICLSNESVSTMPDRIKNLWVVAVSTDFDNHYLCSFDLSAPESFKATSRVLKIPPGGVLTGTARFSEPLPPGEYLLYSCFTIRGRDPYPIFMWRGRLATPPLRITVKE